MEAGGVTGAAGGRASGSVSAPRWPQAPSRLSRHSKANATSRPKTLADRRWSGATTLDAARYGMPRSVAIAMSASPFSDAQYQQRASAVLASIEAQVDRWLDEDLIDIDSHRTGGLLELALPNGSKLIINTQPPLHEIWLAAKAGGYHFRLDQSGRWLDTRDGADFFQRLSEQASAQAGTALTFAPC
jgi:CyaY protein